MPKITIEGKPRIHFSTNDPNAIWRQKEKIVAVIESFLQKDEDLYTYSSVDIPNIVGDPTEVDVAFSSLSDPDDFFEFVQVRDRDNSEGRPWVEQILGQRKSLGLEAGIMVSTTSFSDQAIRLAKSQNIPLRLLLPETEENIKSWYKHSAIGLQSPLVEITRSSIIVVKADRLFELKADRDKSLENNILVSTQNTGQYKVISLKRVFNNDVMRDPDRESELIEKVPKDEVFHKATMTIEYEEPRLFVRFVSTPNDPVEVDGQAEILPIRAIVFFVEVNRRFVNYPITERYRYIDAITNEILAQALVSEMMLEDQRYYSCLVRHRITREKYNIGGAYFR